MKIDHNTNIISLLSDVPECMEQLYPFKRFIREDTTLASLAINAGVPTVALEYGIKRTVKRALQNSLDYAAMKNKLVKKDAVNIAGFVNFLWQKEFVEEMQRKAEGLGVELNINIFPKHSKKQFQNYLAVCKSADDLPEVLIGKGFSSLMTKLFVDRFIKTGAYQYADKGVHLGDVFLDTNILDKQDCYHPFAIEEMVMVLDRNNPLNAPKPQCWHDLTKPEYVNSIMQMGKNQRDHFGFNIMLYLYRNGGLEAIEKYASNVKDKQHFAHIIREIGNDTADKAPISIVHQFASLFIRSDVRESVEVIDATDGNPVTCHFFLLKKDASDASVQMARHLYSSPIKTLIEKCGSSHISSNNLFSGNNKFQWVGWDFIKDLSLPYLKEHLSEVAYQNYKTEKV